MSGRLREPSYNPPAFESEKQQIRENRLEAERIQAYDSIDDTKAEGTEHETLPASESVHDLGADYGADYSDGVQTSSETSLLDRGIASLLEENGGIRCDGLIKCRPISGVNDAIRIWKLTVIPVHEAMICNQIHNHALRPSR